MFAGDEITGIVIDFGSDTLKAGFAGEDAPKAIIPSYYGLQYQDSDAAPIQEAGADVDMVAGSSSAAASSSSSSSKQKKYYPGNNGVLLRRDHVEIRRPFEEGIINDFDAAESILRHALQEVLGADMSEYPVLLAEPVFNTKAAREAMCQLMFEKFNVPAFYFAKTPVLAAFASGKTSSLVVDSGASTTSVTPVYEGYALVKAHVKVNIGGDTVTNTLLSHLNAMDTLIRPQYSFSRKMAVTGLGFDIKEFSYPATTDSYKAYCQFKIVNDIKEATFKALEVPYDPVRYHNATKERYELPDGSELYIGNERYQIPENLFFSPSAIRDKELNIMSPPIPGCVSLASMVAESASKCDADQKKELYSNVILTGGNTLLFGLQKRFEKELQAKCAQTVRPKFVPAAAGVDRKYNPWIGGSILSSLGTFQQMWVSKQEYEEHGASIIQKRCN